MVDDEVDGIGPGTVAAVVVVVDPGGEVTVVVVLPGVVVVVESPGTGMSAPRAAPAPPNTAAPRDTRPSRATGARVRLLAQPALGRPG